MAVVKLDFKAEIINALSSHKNGLTTLELAVFISASRTHSVLPSDLTQPITSLRDKGKIKASGRRKNPILRGKRESRTATVYTIA